ncbi:site-specific integrase [Caulobacter sp. 17J80-11]|uniref:tyrosine-type recombinase/integrase n=1 Tax=Caulobacter sp. 17J80-11 TaxID=2763502 RepID=UPI0016539A76|nr:site-specific integrase [Caulobacter sp. 17J80-11]MBC6982864.1 tyrosine-type recombinase/integrase [Caulobacter sp. 17J80-11]
MRAINRLTARTVATITKKGLHADGLGLYLRVDSGKRWVFIFQWEGARKEMGLGSAATVSLAEARQLARDAHELRKAGKNPIEERRKEKVAPKTFGEVAEALLDDIEGGWRNAKHRQQWRNTLRTYATTFWNVPVDAVTTDQVLRALKPLWTEKAETAQRFRGRVERVLDAAKAQGLRSGENPARWRGHLSLLLPKPSRVSRPHHAALPFEEIQSFLGRLGALSAVSARALEFTILTAARSGETLGAKWSEIDLEKRVWTVPAERMKAGVQHRVPLTDKAVALLESVAGLGEVYVFPGSRPGKPLSNMAMEMLLRRMKVAVTVHGFRSTFRDWAGETTDFPRETAEAALAHKVGDEVERAYRRGDALEKRRKLMDAWASYCYGAQEAPLLAAQ